jgi:anti-sigma-K factor RskA
MLGEKTAILAHLKKLRADAPGLRWRLAGVAISSAVGMAAAIAVVPGQTGHNTPKETVLEHLGTPKVTIRAATNGRSSARAASARESHWEPPCGDSG